MTIMPKTNNKGASKHIGLLAVLLIVSMTWLSACGSSSSSSTPATLYSKLISIRAKVVDVTANKAKLTAEEAKQAAVILAAGGTTSTALTAATAAKTAATSGESALTATITATAAVETALETAVVKEAELKTAKKGTDDSAITNAQTALTAAETDVKTKEGLLETELKETDVVAALKLAAKLPKLDTVAKRKAAATAAATEIDRLIALMTAESTRLAVSGAAPGTAGNSSTVSSHVTALGTLKVTADALKSAIFGASGKVVEAETDVKAKLTAFEGGITTANLSALTTADGVLTNALTTEATARVAHDKELAKSANAAAVTAANTLPYVTTP